LAPPQILGWLRDCAQLAPLFITITLALTIVSRTVAHWWSTYGTADKRPKRNNFVFIIRVLKPCFTAKCETLSEAGTDSGWTANYVCFDKARRRYSL